MNFHVLLSKHSSPLLNFTVTVAHSNKPIIIIIIIGVCMQKINLRITYGNSLQILCELHAFCNL